MINHFFRDWLIPLIALINGIIGFRKFNPALRIYFYQLVFSLLVLFFSYLITSWQLNHQQTVNNHWFMNIVPLAEPCWLFYGAAKVSKNRKMNTLMQLFILCIFSTAIYEYSLNGVYHYLFITDTIGCLLEVIVYGLLLYNLFQQKHRNWYSSPIIWIALGIFIYAACSTPYISLFAYLSKYFPKDNHFLYVFINGIICNIRYLFLSLAFGLVIFLPKEKLTSA